MTRASMLKELLLDISVKTDTLSSPTLKKDKDGTKAIINATVASEDAFLHTVMKDRDGKIAFINSKALKASESAIREEIVPEVPAGFVGKLQFYLWNSDNLPLTAMREIDVNISSVSDYNIGPMTAKSLVAKGRCAA